MREKTIRVCDECDVPMIWTFLFPYCERYCLNCGRAGGMFGTGRDVPVTRELIFQKRLVDALWKVLYSNKGASSKGGFGRNGCKKCDEDPNAYNHREHMSKAEKEWDELGWKYINKIKGSIKSID